MRMKKVLYYFLAGLIGLGTLLTTGTALAAGISASGGGNKVVGQNFTITVTASGAEFDSLQGVISVSGPVSIVSFSGGSATWLPGKSPGNGKQFVGIVSPTKSLTVASITLKGTSEGRGSVSVSGVQLARNGAYVGNSGGSTSFTIGRAPTPPGTIAVSSTTHPDQTVAYEATAIEIQWTAPSNGASGYSTAFNESSDSTPDQKVTTTDTHVTLTDVAIGTHYFHVRAQNNDGWGPVAHFKVTIKEPDAKIDETLTAPTITGVVKNSGFTTDVTIGTVRGFVIQGTGGIAGYTINLAFEPKDRLPTELFQPVAVKTDVEPESTPTISPSPTTTTTATPTPLTPLMATPSADGSWSISIDYPVPAAFYKLTAQGQKDKTLTPVSAPASLELTVAEGGDVKLITDADKTVGGKGQVQVLGIKFPSRTSFWLTILVIVLLLVSAQLGLWLLRDKIRWPLFHFKRSKTDTTKTDAGPKPKQFG